MDHLGKAKRAIIITGVCLAIIIVLQAIILTLNLRAAPAPLTTLDANQAVSQWAEAARMRDYATTGAYMRGLDPLTLATWREENERNVSHAWIGSYVGAKLTKEGDDYRARVQWNGKGPHPICMELRVTRERQITPLSMPRFCKPGTEL